MEVKDAIGTVLSTGDTVVLTKSLKPKGVQGQIKKGLKIKNIRLTDNPQEIDCRIPKVGNLVIRTEFVKKSTK
jgi:protein PhnA